MNGLGFKLMSNLGSTNECYWCLEFSFALCQPRLAAASVCIDVNRTSRDPCSYDNTGTSIAQNVSHHSDK